MDAKPPPVDEAVIAAAREVIEQAKGALMLVYSVDAAQAFAILRAASQDANIKIRELAAGVVAELPLIGASYPVGELRESLDRLLFGTTADSPLA